MNNIITNHYYQNTFTLIAYELSKIGYNVCFISFVGDRIPEHIYNNDKIIKRSYFNSLNLVLDKDELKHFLLENKFDFIFMNNQHIFSQRLINFFDEIICSDIFYTHPPYTLSKKYHSNSNYSFYNFREILFDKFILKYTRNQKLKTILKNE
jgi:hypothetical protein